MDEPSPPETPPSGNPAIGLLRLVIWLLPAIIVPVIVVAFYSLGDMFYSAMRGWWLVPTLLIFVTVYFLGVFDYRLRCQQQRIASRSRDGEKINWAMTFLLLQFVIAPAVAMSVLFGICIVTGAAR